MTSNGATKEACETIVARRKVPNIDEVEATRRARARFPFQKTIEMFDFSVQPALRLEQLASQLSPRFATDGESLILTGKPGRGKTHLAVAIAQRAIEHGHDARFVSTSRLVDSVCGQIARGRGRSAMLRYLRTAVLVLDDVVSARHNPHLASILFEIVSERHRRGRSMIVTAHQPIEQWGELLGDQDIADAIVGRLLERGTHIALGGASLRTPRSDGAVQAEPVQRAPALPVAEPARPLLRLATLGATTTPEDGEELCKRFARQIVGRLGLKEAIYHLRGAMSFEALERTRGSRRAAANLLGVDRRYVQRLVEEYTEDEPSFNDFSTSSKDVL